MAERDEAEDDGVRVSTINDIPRHRLSRQEVNISTSSESTDDEESWASRTGRTKPDKTRRKSDSPPLIDFKKPEIKKFENAHEEAEDRFNDALS